MKRGRRLLPWQRQAIEDGYRAGEKVAALAAEFDVTPRGLRRLINRLGVPMRAPHRPKGERLPAPC